MRFRALIRLIPGEGGVVSHRPTVSTGSVSGTTSSELTGGTEAMMLQLQVQQRMTEHIHNLENQVGRHVEEYNWIVQSLLTEAMKERLLQWQIERNDKKESDYLMQSITGNYNRHAALVKSDGTYSDSDKDES